MEKFIDRYSEDVNYKNIYRKSEIVILNNS